ncbi:MAG: transcriptional repressor [Candidatus Kerfeldbacteria bacterium]|nr:transcriptional repressor [Candidatus Kerfeldbacteria bacterium]
MNYEARVTGFRHTPQRMLVLRTVKASREFRTAEDVLRAVKQQFPRIGFATVYRNLNLLQRRGEIFGFEGPDGVRQFAGFVFHEATFTCQRCGKVERLPVSQQSVLDRAVKDRTVFFSRLDVRGLCADHRSEAR